MIGEKLRVQLRPNHTQGGKIVFWQLDILLLLSPDGCVSMQPNHQILYWEIFASLLMCASTFITAGKSARKLPYQHCTDTHPHHHFCSQEGQKPEEKGSCCCLGHCTGIFWNQHGAEETTGMNSAYVPWAGTGWNSPLHGLKILYYIIIFSTQTWYSSVVINLLKILCTFCLLSSDRKLLSKQQGKRAKPLWSLTWETCWQLWRSNSRLWKPGNSPIPSHCLLQVSGKLIIC